MGRNDFTAEWFMDEPWSEAESWKQWEHLSPWQQTWQQFTGIWGIVELLLMLGDQELIQHYTACPPGKKEGPVLRFLPFVRWWKEVILQDAPLRLQFEPETAFFKQHRLFKHQGFRLFFDSVLVPVVLAAHAEGERKCQQKADYDPHLAQACISYCSVFVLLTYLFLLIYLHLCMMSQALYTVQETMEKKQHDMELKMQ